MGHPTACAAANAVLTRLLDDHLLARVQPLGEALNSALRSRLGDHPHVGDIRGRGLFRGVELVSDRADKTPFDPSHRLHAKVKQQAMANGLMCYPMGGTVDGRFGDHVLLAPPFIVDENQINEIVDRLAAAIDAAIDQT